MGSIVVFIVIFSNRSGLVSINCNIGMYGCDFFDLGIVCYFCK